MEIIRQNTKKADRKKKKEGRKKKGRNKSPLKHFSGLKNERKSLLAERLRTKKNTKNTLIIRFVSVFTL